MMYLGDKPVKAIARSKNNLLNAPRFLEFKGTGSEYYFDVDLTGTYTLSFRARTTSYDIANAAFVRIYVDGSPQYITHVVYEDMVLTKKITGHITAIQFVNFGRMYCSVTEIMLNEGSTALPYEPYNQLFTVPIKKIYTNTRTVTFNGTENWRIYPCEKGQRVYLDGGVPPFKAPQTWVVMENASSNYYNVVSANSTYQGIKGISFEGTKRIHCYDSEYGQSLSKWKAYLAELEAQGNPLSVTYESTEAVVIGYEY